MRIESGPGLCAAVVVLVALCACGSLDGRNGCSAGDYPDQRTSSYFLPWTPGESYVVVNGNCGNGITHNGTARYSYDFPAREQTDARGVPSHERGRARGLTPQRSRVAR